MTFIFIALLINSSYGRAFKAIREDEIAAEAMGVSLFWHKNLAFMISAFLPAWAAACMVRCWELLIRRISFLH